jgi:putative MFS transporter
MKFYGNNPWWIPPFLFGRMPDVEDRLIKLLGFVALALLFENYDFSLLNAALKYIAADLNIAESELSFFVAIIRLGALPAFLIIPLSDHIGRRRLFMISVGGMSIGTLCTAFSASQFQFILFQVFSRTFMLTASAIAIVFITEEFPADRRGWGIGMLAAIGAVGQGLGALLFGLVDYLPYGWRFLYFVGVGPFLLLPIFLRNIPETRRFSQQEDRVVSARHLVAGWFTPMADIVRHFPARAGAVITMGMMASFGHNAVFLFIGYFVMTYHGWEPWQFSAMFFLCGAFGIPGNVAAGYMADRYGRRVVGFSFLVIFPLLAWLFYTGPEYILPFIWILMVFAVMGGNVIIRALSTELFPTAMRGTSAGMLALMETVGAGSGLLILGMIATEQGELIGFIPFISLATLIAGVVLLLLPETSQQELEKLSQVPPHPDAGVPDAEPRE